MRLFLAFLLAMPWQVFGTDIHVNVPPGQALTIEGGTIVTFNLDVWGCDNVDVYLNGGPLAGALLYPYTVSFTSVLNGANLLQFVTCDILGRTATNSVTILSIQSSPLVPIRRILR